jgi:hypothetical protein
MTNDINLNNIIYSNKILADEKMRFSTYDKSINDKYNNNSQAEYHTFFKSKTDVKNNINNYNDEDTHKLRELRDVSTDAFLSHMNIDNKDPKTIFNFTKFLYEYVIIEVISKINNNIYINVSEHIAKKDKNNNNKSEEFTERTDIPHNDEKNDGNNDEKIIIKNYAEYYYNENIESIQVFLKGGTLMKFMSNVITNMISDDDITTKFKFSDIDLSIYINSYNSLKFNYLYFIVCQELLKCLKEMSYVLYYFYYDRDNREQKKQHIKRIIDSIHVEEISKDNAKQTDDLMIPLFTINKVIFELKTHNVSDVSTQVYLLYDYHVIKDNKLTVLTMNLMYQTSLINTLTLAKKMVSNLDSSSITKINELLCVYGNSLFKRKLTNILLLMDITFDKNGLLTTISTEINKIKNDTTRNKNNELYFIKEENKKKIVFNKDFVNNNDDNENNYNTDDNFKYMEKNDIFMDITNSLFYNKDIYECNSVNKNIIINKINYEHDCNKDASINIINYMDKMNNYENIFYVSSNSTIYNDNLKPGFINDFDLYRIKMNIQGIDILKDSGNNQPINNLIPSEILDVSIPKYTDSIRTHHDKESITINDFEDFSVIKRKCTTIYDDINTNIIILNTQNLYIDLMHVLFSQGCEKLLTPWKDVKYNKRLFRLSFFIFMDLMFRNIVYEHFNIIVLLIEQINTYIQTNDALHNKESYVKILGIFNTISNKTVDDTYFNFENIMNNMTLSEENIISNIGLTNNLFSLIDLKNEYKIYFSIINLLYFYICTFKYLKNSGDVVNNVLYNNIFNLMHELKYKHYVYFFKITDEDIQAHVDDICNSFKLFITSLSANFNTFKKLYETHKDIIIKKEIKYKTLQFYINGKAGGKKTRKNIGNNKKKTKKKKSFYEYNIIQ